jgi:hypothetical protein
VRTRAAAALIAALAVLAWVAPSAMATSRSASRAAVSASWKPSPGSQPSHGSQPSGLSDAAWIVGTAVVVLVLVVVVIRLRSRGNAGVGFTARQDAAPDIAAIEELAAQASAALVAADDVIRTSEQELGFATATFGEHATARFTGAVQSAQAELSAAVRLRQRLDDNEVSDASARAAQLIQISARCAGANRLLDEHAAEFDELRDLEGRAPRLAAEVDAHIAQQSARIGRSRQILDTLAAKYTVDAVIAVLANPDEAADRLGFATSSLASATQNLADGRSDEAAVLLQAAESGADQATDLLDAVQHLEAELTQAFSALPAALREVDAEIAEAGGQRTEQPPDERARLVARAQGIADNVRRQQAGAEFDALAALRAVQQVDAALDYSLASDRAEPARRERASAVLDQAMLVARSSVRTADDFIATRRGAVGATARTRLIEGQRHFRQSIAAARRDPEAALAEAQQADELAQQARMAAEQDVARFNYRGPAWLRAADGAGGVSAVDDGVGSAMLGGILIISSRRASAAGPRIGPASFGGTGTRGRHHIGDEHTASQGGRCPSTESPVA